MTLSMKRDIAVEWVERLESLDPELQGNGCLNNNGKMCCLGVLTEIAADRGIVNRFVDHRGKTVYSDENTGDLYGERFYLHDKVIEWAGIESTADDGAATPRNPHFGGDYAAVHNDSNRKSFKEIAGLLRTELNL